MITSVSYNKHLLLPQNYLAEEIVLGTIFVYPHIFDNIMPWIKTEYFFLECHKIIYTNLLFINQKHKLNSSEFIYITGKNSILYKIGGIYKIWELMKQSQIFIISVQNISLYIEELLNIIQYNYIKRLLIQYGYNIIQLAYFNKLSHYNLYNKASSYLSVTEKQIPKNKIKNFKQLLTEFLLQIKYNKNNEQSNITKRIDLLLKSGFRDLDELIFGLSAGDLIIIAGRPATGKTSLAINIANNIINKTTSYIYFFSLEMSNRQILNRFIAINTNIPLKSFIIKNFTKTEWQKIVETCYKLININIYIDDQPNISIDYIEYTTKLLKKDNIKIDLIIIDYLQLIQTSFSNTINRTQELSYITRKLKLLAQYLNLPIIILSQLNRNIENRSNKKPLLSDLKDSGCIEIANNFNTINNKNNINIKTFLYFSIPENILTNIFNRVYKDITVNLINKKKSVFLFSQYIFQCQINQKNQIFITYNHKYLYKNKWTNIIFMYQTSLLKIKYKVQNIYMKYNKYLHKIQFNNYSKCYDFKMQYYFHFICNYTILHNSIEQDADIVMIVSAEEKQNNYDKVISNDKLLNVNLCKNRNGPIGSIKLLFYEHTTLFKNNNHNISKNNNI